MKILQVPMRPENNIIVFATKVQEKYLDICDLYAVNALPLTVDHCIALNITQKMTTCGKLLYFDTYCYDPSRQFCNEKSALLSLICLNLQF